MNALAFSVKTKANESEGQFFSILCSTSLMPVALCVSLKALT